MPSGRRGRTSPGARPPAHGREGPADDARPLATTAPARARRGRLEPAARVQLHARRRRAARPRPESARADLRRRQRHRHAPHVRGDRPSCDAWAGLLRGYRLQAGNVVLVAAGPSPAWPAIVLGALKAGLVVAPLAPDVGRRGARPPCGLDPRVARRRGPGRRARDRNGASLAHRHHRDGLPGRDGRPAARPAPGAPTHPTVPREPALVLATSGTAGHRGSCATATPTCGRSGSSGSTGSAPTATTSSVHGGHA